MAEARDAVLRNQLEIEPIRCFIYIAAAAVAVEFWLSSGTIRRIFTYIYTYK